MIHAIGVDLGGTFVKAGLVNAAGKVLGPILNRPVERDADGEQLSRAVAGVAAEALGSRKARAIGVAIPASVAAPQGRVVRGTSNLKGLE